MVIVLVKRHRTLLPENFHIQMDSSESKVSEKSGAVQIFSSDDSARKVIYLAVMNASKKWTMLIQNWRLAMNWFTIHFDDRLRGHL